MVSRVILLSCIVGDGDASDSGPVAKKDASGGYEKNINGI